jgi:hypothetical protein
MVYVSLSTKKQTESLTNCYSMQRTLILLILLLNALSCRIDHQKYPNSLGSPPDSLAIESETINLPYRALKILSFSDKEIIIYTFEGSIVKYNLVDKITIWKNDQFNAKHSTIFLFKNNEIFWVPFTWGPIVRIDSIGNVTHVYKNYSNNNNTTRGTLAMSIFDLGNELFASCDMNGLLLFNTKSNKGINIIQKSEVHSVVLESFFSLNQILFFSQNDFSLPNSTLYLYDFTSNIFLDSIPLKGQIISNLQADSTNLFFVSCEEDTSNGFTRKYLLYAMDYSGNLHWKKEFSSYVDYSIRQKGDHLYVLANEILYKFEKHTGKEILKITVPEHSNLLVQSDRVIAYNSQQIYLMDLDGRLLNFVNANNILDLNIFSDQVVFVDDGIVKLLPLFESEIR